MSAREGTTGPVLDWVRISMVASTVRGAKVARLCYRDPTNIATFRESTHLPFSEWGQIFQGERMTAALLDRLTHHCHILEMNGESYRFRESMKAKKGRKAE